MPITAEELTQHHKQVAEAILLGRVVPFLGAGVNLIDRPDCETFQVGSNFPSGGELAAYLAARFSYPGVEACPMAPQFAGAGAAMAPLAGDAAHPHCLRPQAQIDLARVAQYGDSMLGDATLYEVLRDVFHVTLAPTSAHRFLASLPSPAGQAAATGEGRHPLIVSTNYDDLLERQYEVAGRQKDYDLVFYRPVAGGRSLFYHASGDAPPVPIQDASNYSYPFFERRPVVLKIHGTIRRDDPTEDAYVITENDYVTYLADNTLEALLPRRLLKKLQTNHLLFMGYSLQDWNLRVFLQRIKRTQRSYRAWAIVRGDNPAERVFWEHHGIQIIPNGLADYLDGLNGALQRTRPGA